MSEAEMTIAKEIIAAIKLRLHALKDFEICSVTVEHLILASRYGTVLELPNGDKVSLTLTRQAVTP